MTRVLVICEGPTEYAFVEQVLSPYFAEHAIYISPRILGVVGHQGGNVNYPRLLKDIRRLLSGDANLFCTCLIDYYGISAQFPGYLQSTTFTLTGAKKEAILSVFSTQLQQDLSEHQFRRFIPYIQMHEFEGLLFSDPKNLAEAINQPNLSQSFQDIRNSCTSPEDINNNKLTAPSKRIEQLFPAFRKTSHCLIAAQAIGINAIRQECPLFDAWLRQLEQLAPS